MNRRDARLASEKQGCTRYRARRDAGHAPGAARGSKQRGSVLLAVVLLGAVSAAMSASLVGRASSLAAELRVRRDVLCARYAALGGLALGAPTTDPIAAAALVGPDVSLLQVSLVRIAPTWCVLRATASCRHATRTLDRTMADTTLCNAPPG